MNEKTSFLQSTNLTSPKKPWKIENYHNYLTNKAIGIIIATCFSGWVEGVFKLWERNDTASLRQFENKITPFPVWQAIKETSPPYDKAGRFLGLPGQKILYNTLFKKNIRKNVWFFELNTKCQPRPVYHRRRYL